MNRRRVLACLFLLLTAAAPPARPQAPDLFRDWEKKVNAIRDNEKKEFERIAAEMRRSNERLRPFWLMQEAEILDGTSQLAEAAGKADGAVAELEKKGPDNWGPAGAVAYREALLLSGRLHAAMGDPEQACERARRAWEVHERLPSSRRPSGAADRIDAARTALAVALVLFAGDQPGAADPFLRRMFDECGKMPEPLRRPDSNPFLAEGWLLKSMLANGDGNYPAAREEAERAVASFRARFPPRTNPEGDPKLAEALVNLALAHVALGELVPARPLLGEADAMLARHAPRGELLRAEILRILGQLHLRRREAEAALRDIDGARATYERLFPESKYPKSHLMLIQALTSMAALFNQFGEHGRAVEFAGAAERQCRRRYDKPHRQHVDALLTYGSCLRDAGRLEEAGRQFADALDMARELERTNPTPASGQLVALVRLRLGNLLGRRGQYLEAERLLREAEATYRRLSPDGHPHWLAAAADRGTFALRRGDRGAAREAFAAALDLDRKQLRRLARTAAEVEALTFTQPRQVALHGYLSATRDDPAGDEAAFEHVWGAKNAVTRLAQARKAALRLAGEKNPEARRLMARMVEASARLRGERTAARDGTTTAELLKELDGLELELSKFWPDAEKRLDQAEGLPRDLSARLPRRSAFIDFLRYDEPGDGRSAESRYVAFVVSPGRAARRVELGPAAPIDGAIRDWRESVDRWTPLASEPSRAWEAKGERQAALIRRDAWEPIAGLLPADTRLVLLAPDGDLARFPFAALPGSRPGSILLEEFSLAYVPHGPFLLEQLLRPEDDSARPDRFLAVGGVDYGPPTAEPRRAFAPLPGSLAVVELARRRAAAGTVHLLSGRGASVERALGELSAATEAQISTHAFFDETAWNEDHRRLTRMFRDWAPRPGASAGPVGAGQRFPLSYVGLVLAGANDPETAGLGGGILSGEAIAPLPLSRLRWTMLDGCQTGLGEYTAGEGVQALARAFHLAGCPNVIATLWHVHDGAAQALTDEFHRQIRDNRLPTPEALRRAQLALFRDPGRVRLRGDLRGAPSGVPSGGGTFACRPAARGSHRLTRRCGGPRTSIRGLASRSWSRPRWTSTWLACRARNRADLPRNPRRPRPAWGRRWAGGSAPGPS